MWQEKGLKVQRSSAWKCMFNPLPNFHHLHVFLSSILYIRRSTCTTWCRLPQSKQMIDYLDEENSSKTRNRRSRRSGKCWACYAHHPSSSSSSCSDPHTWEKCCWADEQRKSEEERREKSGREELYNDSLSSSLILCFCFILSVVHTFYWHP